MKRTWIALAGVFLLATGTIRCDGLQGAQGLTGPRGITGTQGNPGLDGSMGQNGTPGLVSGSRIKPRIVNTDDGMQAATGTYWDEQRQEVCAMANFNGLCKCLPVNKPVSVLYTEDGCDVDSRVLMSPGTLSGCNGNQVQYLSSQVDSPDCSGTNGRIYHKEPYVAEGGPSTVSLYQLADGSDGPVCIPASLPETYELYKAIGTEVDVESFAKCTISP